MNLNTSKTDFESAIHALADLPSSVVSVIPIALFLALCLLCMVPSIAARIRGGR